MDLQAHFGRRLAELREARGLSQHQLAKAVGVSSQFVGRIETGSRAPSFGVLEKLSAKLSVEPAELFGPIPEGVTKRAGRMASDLPKLIGAAQRLSEDDLRCLLDLARRLGRSAR